MNYASARFTRAAADRAIRRLRGRASRYNTNPPRTLNIGPLSDSSASSSTARHRADYRDQQYERLPSDFTPSRGVVVLAAPTRMRAEARIRWRKPHDFRQRVGSYDRSTTARGDDHLQRARRVFAALRREPSLR